MDFELEQRFLKVQQELAKDIGENPDLQSIIFLIGVQELGKGYQQFSKQQKVDLMHIAICTLFEPYGYYKYIGNDKDGWPHYENLKKMPPLDGRQQQLLLKQAIVDYFNITE